MPAMEDADLTQNVTIWAVSGIPDRHGVQKVGEPEEILARWELSGGWGSSIRKGRFNPRDAFSSTIEVDALLFTSTDMTEGTIVYLDTLDEYYGVGSAGDATNLYEVVSFAKIPDDKGRNFRRISALARHRDTLPELDS